VPTRVPTTGTAASDVALASAVLTGALDVSSGKPPEWVQLMPAGAFKPADGRPGWTLPDAQAVIGASLAAAAGGMLPMDYDHALDLAAPQGGRAPAAGWMTALEARADGIWAKVEWTDAGARAVASREYRFLSPAFLHAKDGTVTRILGAALVNRPALPQLPALAAHHGEPMNELLRKLLEALGLPETADQTTALAAVSTLKAGTGQLTALCSAAGLEASATIDQLAATITGLKTAAGQVKAIAAAAGLPEATPAEQVITAVKGLKGGASLLEQQVATLAAQVNSLVGDKHTAKVDDAIKAGKFTPAQRGDLLALASANPDLLDRMIASAPVILSPGSTDLGTRQAAEGELTAEQKAVCAAMGLSEDAFKKSLAAQKTGA